MSNKIKEQFNFEYFSMWREVLVFLFAELLKTEVRENKNGRILIVNPCLIGEFVASIPAIHDFIKRNYDKKIDLLVTPRTKEIAEKMIGVHKIFVTKSAYIGRAEVEIDYKEQKFDSYEKIIFLRISEIAYATTFNIRGSEISTSFSGMSQYALHLAKSLIIGKTPRSWRSMNFEILGGREKNFIFEEIFDFKKGDYKKLESFDFLKNKTKKIIIHVGTKWSMKRWNKDKWVELLEKINKLGHFTFIFIGSDDDIEDHNYISSKLSFKTESLIKKISLAELLLVLKDADYFIGIDSGPSNMAHLVNLRSITIYGPGPHMYMPFHPDDIVFDKTSGRGLFQLLFRVKNSYINKVAVNEVYDAFYGLYNKDNKNEKL